MSSINEKIISWFRSSLLYRFWRKYMDKREWRKRQYAAPSPHYIKQACIIRNGIPDAIWIETGTFLGHTTKLLSKHAKHVYSIEPEPTLYENANKYFSTFSNVNILHGTSEDVFPSLLPTIDGQVNFWLDGHYSAGITYKGDKDTPINEELSTISHNIHRFSNLCVLIDDIRCFNPHIDEYSSYPSLEVLVDWARDNNLIWHIEHDIFIARTKSQL